MNNNKKQIMLSILAIFVLMLGVIGASYAFFTYTRTGTSNNVMQTGEIFFDFAEKNGIEIVNVMPDSTINDVLEFKLIGRNQGTQPIYYTVYAIPGEEQVGKTLLKDEEVKLTLTSTTTGSITVDQNKFETATKVGGADNSTRNGGNLVLATGKVNTTSTNAVANFTLKMELNKDEILISDTNLNADYCSSGTTDTSEYLETGKIECVSNKPLWNKTYYSLKLQVNSSTTEPEPEKVTKLLDDNDNGIADIGEMIQIGTERFYVYSNDGTNIKALAEYNLLVGNSYDGSTITPLSNPTGLQDSSAIGYHYAPGTTTVEYPSIGTTAFSSSSQKGTDYSDYEGSIVEGYVNEYKTKLEEMGATIQKATLISKEEIETLINNGNSLSSGYINTKADPLNMQWLYKTSYWTRSASSGHIVWDVSSYSYLYDDYSSISDGRGVRPVIEILVSDI